MGKLRILFVCVHNSALCQMAEAFLNALAPERFEAVSAGLEPGRLNQAAVEVIREIGVDISRNTTKAVFDFIKRGDFFSYVIAVCDEGSAERCPIFPGPVMRLHWSFPDPSAISGNREEILAGTRKVRDAIRSEIENFLHERE